MHWNAEGNPYHLPADVVIPVLGLSSENVLLTSWKKKKGDVVVKGEPLFSIETEKVSMDIPSPESGILSEVFAEAGKEVPVGQRIAVIADSAGEEVAQTISNEPSQAIPNVPPKLSEKPTVLEEIPLVGFRGTIASRMILSAQTIPQVTLHQYCNASNLVQMKETFGKRLGSDSGIFDAIFVKLASESLKTVNVLNAFVEDGKIRILKEHNISVAIATDQGLIAPVIKGVEEKGVREIIETLLELARKARDRTLETGELSDSTFTVSNLGMYNTDLFTPLVNPPQVAILGIGRISNQGEGRKQIGLSLTFDHRAADGHTAARFLNSLCEKVEDSSALKEIMASGKTAQD